MHGPTPLALNGGRVYAEFDSYYQRRARTSITRLYKNIALHDNRRVTVRESIQHTKATSITADALETGQYNV